MPSKHNTFLDAPSSDDSDDNRGYDSEAAEQSKGRSFTRFVPSLHSRKRRRLSAGSDRVDASPSEQEREFEDDGHMKASADQSLADEDTTEQKPILHPAASSDQPPASELHTSRAASVKASRVARKNIIKEKTPGVIYLSSLPPYLRPSALRNLLTQRGFSPITRLFLTPASKAGSASKNKSRQLYTEGWVEFASKKTARRCAETLNATPVGGRKGGFYHDDVWNMRYLRGMGWSELMAGVREERREEEGRRDEERRVIARQTKAFVEGVEDGKKFKGIQESTQDREKDAREGAQKEEISEDVRRVLGKIF